MDKHLQTIMGCAAQFPDMPFGIFLTNVLAGRNYMLKRLVSVTNKTLAAYCIEYCEENSRPYHG